MTKQQFMGELEQLLGELPAVEREEALNYYEDYFADAGEENESTVIEELGSPEKVAFTIKAGLADADKAEGEFTDTGFKGYDDPYKDEIINTIPDSESRGFRQSSGNSRNNALIALLILILLSPIIIPVVCSVFGVLFGLAAAAFGIICAIAASGIGCIVAGAVVFAIAIMGLSAHTMGALLLAGIAILLVGIGGLLVTIGARIIASLLPPLFRSIVSLIQKLVAAINRKRGIV